MSFLNKKFFVRAALALCLLACALILLVFISLPRVISSDWCKNKIQEISSSYIQGDLSLNELSFSWTKGLVLKDLSIVPSTKSRAAPMLRLGRLRADIRIFKDWQLKPKFILECSNELVQVVRDSQGRLNWQDLIKKGKQEPETKKEKPGKGLAFKLPIDFRLNILIKGLEVNYLDKMADLNLNLDQGQFALSTDSVVSAPLEISFQALARLGREEEKRIDFKLRLEDWIQQKGLTLEQASIDLALQFPGAKLSLAGGLAQQRVVAGVELRLEEMQSLIDPWLAQDLPGLEGMLELGAKAEKRGQDRYFAELLIKAQSLTVQDKKLFKAGGDVELKTELNGNLQTLNFDSQLKAEGLDFIDSQGNELVADFRADIHQAGSLDMVSDKLDLRKFELVLGKKSSMGMVARANNLRKNPELDLKIKDIRLYYSDFSLLISNFLPENVQFGPLKKKGDFRLLDLQEMSYLGKVAPLSGQVSLGKLNLNLPRASFEQSGNKVEANEACLRLEDLKLKMEEMLPLEVQLVSSLGFGGLVLSGKNRVSLEGFQTKGIELSLKNLAKSTGSLFGWKGRAKLESGLKIRKISVPGMGSIQGLKQRALLTCLLDQKKGLELALPEFSLVWDGLNLDDLKGYQPERVSLSASLDRLSLTRLNPLDLDIFSAKGELNLNPGASLSLELEAREMGYKELSCFLDLQADLGKFKGLLDDVALSDLDLKGKFNLLGNYQGRIPRPEEIPEKISFTDLDFLKDQFGFIEHFSLKAGLEGSGFQAGLSRQGKFNVQKIGIKKMKISSSSGLKDFQAGLDMDIGEILELPVLGELSNPLQVGLKLQFKEEDLSRFELEEGLKLPQFGINQKLKLQIDALPQLDILDEKTNKALFEFLKGVEGKIRHKIQVKVQDKKRKLMDRLELTGSMENSFQLSLAQNGEVNLGLNALFLDLGVANNKGLKVSGIEGNLNFEKSYSLLPEKIDRPEYNEFLSGMVLDLESGRRDTGPEILGQEIGKDLSSFAVFEPGEREAGRIFIKEFLISGQGIPLEVNDFTALFEQVSGLPGISHLQLNLLGGTLLGSFQFFKQNKIEVELNCAFSGLNAVSLLQRLNIDAPLSEESSISGQIYCRLPLLEDPKKIFEEIKLRFQLSKIGSKSLRQFLYALDPKENNEAIVKQRKLLKTGSPKRITLSLEKGMLTLTGKVRVKGMEIELPPLRRMNLANLQMIEGMQGKIGPVLDLVKMLEILSARGLAPGKDSNWPEPSY